MDSTQMQLRIIDLEDKLKIARAAPCECCVNMSELVGSMQFKLDENEIERQELKKPVKDLSIYFQVGVM